MNIKDIVNINKQIIINNNIIKSIKSEIEESNKKLEELLEYNDYLKGVLDYLESHEY